MGFLEGNNVLSRGLHLCFEVTSPSLPFVEPSAQQSGLMRAVSGLHADLIFFAQQLRDGPAKLFVGCIHLFIFSS